MVLYRSTSLLAPGVQTSIRPMIFHKERGLRCSQSMTQLCLPNQVARAGNLYLDAAGGPNYWAATNDFALTLAPPSSIYQDYNRASLLACCILK